MKRIIMAVCLVLVFSTAAMAQTQSRLVVGVDKSWELEIIEGDYNRIFHPETEYVEININKGKTVLRVYKCGKVVVLEYKEVVPNKDQTTTYYYRPYTDNNVIWSPTGLNKE